MVYEKILDISPPVIFPIIRDSTFITFVTHAAWLRIFIYTNAKHKLTDYLLICALAEAIIQFLTLSLSAV